MDRSGSHKQIQHTTITKLRSIFSTFGIPEVLVSDNGAAFTSEEFEDSMKIP